MKAQYLLYLLLIVVEGCEFASLELLPASQTAIVVQQKNKYFTKP
jgi:hypothetical protein